MINQYLCIRRVRVGLGINQASLPLDGDATVNATGAGVNIFVLDTGCDVGHEQFSGDSREALNVASYGDGFDGAWAYWPEVGWNDPPADLSALENNDRDGHGRHYREPNRQPFDSTAIRYATGTHCSATAVGTTVGVAHGANMYHMKVRVSVHVYASNSPPRGS